MSGRNPMFADLPLGTIITDEMYLERHQDPEFFPVRNFHCFICGERLDYAGKRAVYENVYLFYCKTCNANVEYMRLED